MPDFPEVTQHHYWSLHGDEVTIRLERKKKRKPDEKQATLRAKSKRSKHFQRMRISQQEIDRISEQVSKERRQNLIVCTLLIPLLVFVSYIIHVYSEGDSEAFWIAVILDFPFALVLMYLLAPYFSLLFPSRKDSVLPYIKHIYSVDDFIVEQSHYYEDVENYYTLKEAWFNEQDELYALKEELHQDKIEFTKYLRQLMDCGTQ